MRRCITLTEKLIRPFPSRPGRAVSLLVGDQFRDIQISNTGVEIHVIRPDERRPVIELVRDVKDDHRRRREVDLEERLRLRCGREFMVADRPGAGPELGDEDQAVEDEADPGANDAGLAAEGELVEGVALLRPASPEADVGEADAAPGED